jgi:hypothetical protein
VNWMLQASQTPFVWWLRLFVIRSWRFGMTEFFFRSGNLIRFVMLLSTWPCCAVVTYIYGHLPSVKQPFGYIAPISVVFTPAS